VEDSACYSWIVLSFPDCKINEAAAIKGEIS
jgi:hypothetical protein